MASVSSEISFELKKKAHKLCKKYLGGSWKNVSLDEFSIEVLRYVSLKSRNGSSRMSQLAPRLLRSSIFSSLPHIPFYFETN